MRTALRSVSKPDSCSPVNPRAGSTTRSTARTALAPASRRGARSPPARPYPSDATATGGRASPGSEPAATTSIGQRGLEQLLHRDPVPLGRLFVVRRIVRNGVTVSGRIDLDRVRDASRRQRLIECLRLLRGERAVVLGAADIDGGLDPVGQQMWARRVVGDNAASVE